MSSRSTSDEETDSTSKIDRRSVLRAASAGTAAVGITGVASARSGTDNSVAPSERRAIVAEFDDVNLVQSALAERSDLLSAASDAGYLDSASVEAVGIESLGKPQSESDVQVTVDARATENGAVPEIRIASEFDDGFLQLGFRPGSSTEYAVFDEKDSDEYTELRTQDLCGGCGSNEECQYGCYCYCGSCTYTPDCPDATADKCYTCQCVSNCGWI
jgi:hypothetical protein